MTWELRGFVTVLMVSWLFAGDPLTALKITVVYSPLSLVMYFIHERIWKRIGWGHHEVCARERV
jgi:uncharacterized membrane protein